MLAAIAEGRVQAGDAFAGALEAKDSIFALPSLPFLVASTADAKRLADIARPHLAAALQKIRPAAALPDTLAAVGHLVEDPADVAVRSRRTFHPHL